MTTYSLFGQAAETVTGTGAGNAGTIGLHFTVSAPATLQGLWLYSPSGQGLTQLPASIALYNYSTQALITSSTASWSGAAGSGWVFAAFSSPPSLAAGTGYMAAAFRNDAVNGWFCFDDAYTWPASSGIITAPDDVPAGQGWYTNTVTPAFPASQLAGYNWWLDVQVSTSAPFTQPGKAVKGARSARKGTSAAPFGTLRYTGPVTVSPFPQPGKAAKGRPSARKGVPAGAPGAPYVYVPVIPAPFTQPNRAAAGRPAARKGTGRAVNPGAPYTFVPVTIPPFPQPHRAVTGRPSARRGSASGTRPAAWTPLVQETSGSTTGTTLTLTFPLPLTPGNAVIIALAGYTGGSVTGFTVGGSAVTFVKAAAAGGFNAEVWWSVPTTRSATVTVTCSAAGITGYAYEARGIVCLDTSAGNSGTSGTSWSSGATGATIPYQHMVVGLGMISGNTGGITGLSAAPWANLPAYTNVASGGSHFGAVSGYQQPPGSGTYTYAGTSASGGDWAAVTAAFLATPSTAGGTVGQVITNWGGYVFDEHAAAGYTGITATFTIPPVSSANYDSIWVGLGNVYQVGLFQTYVSSGFTGNSSTRPWTWWLPGAGEDWNQGAFPTAYGDTITLSMQVTATNWLMTIANATEGWTYTEVRSIASVNIGSIEGNGTGPAFWPFPLPTAEVIIERELVPLPDYGSIAFSSIVTTPPATVPPYAVFTVNAAIDQYPGPFNLANGSFTMFWNSAS